MLEPDDIHSGHFKFHAYSIAFDCNVECPAAMFMGPKFAMLGLSDGGIYGEGPKNKDCT
jgi:hypothetical protein